LVWCTQIQEPNIAFKRTQARLPNAAVEKYHNDFVSYSQAAESHCRALGFKFVENPRRQQQTIHTASITHA
jgi:hypothetical protein